MRTRVAVARLSKIAIDGASPGDDDVRSSAMSKGKKAEPPAEPTPEPQADPTPEPSAEPTPSPPTPEPTPSPPSEAVDDAAPAVDAEPSEAAQEAAAEISAAVVAAQDDSTVDDGTGTPIPVFSAVLLLSHIVCG